MKRLLVLFILVVSTATAQAATVTLRWKDNANNEDGFRVYRRVGAVFVLLPVTIPANATSAAGVVFAAGQEECYQIAAFNSAGESDRLEICVDTRAKPPAPPSETSIEVIP